MNVLVINCGSSSLKYQLINSDSEEVLAKGLCERIGIDGRLVYQKEGLDKEITEAPMPTHKEAIQMVLDALVNPKTGAVKSLAEIDAVGHRVVHGGEKFSDSVVITEEVIAQVEECNDLAPLHNPANIIGIRACQALMPNVPMVGVFDTAFHQTMPEKAYLYGLPYEYYEKYKVRRKASCDKPQLRIKGGSKLPWNGLKQLKDYRSTPWKRSFSQRSIKR